MYSYLQREVASAQSYTGTKWTMYQTQRSERMYLKEGQAYYFEALHNDYGSGHFINVGLHKDTTSLTHSDAPMSVSEEQELIISSTRAQEEQVCVYLEDPSLDTNERYEEETFHSTL